MSLSVKVLQADITGFIPASVLISLWPFRRVQVTCKAQSEVTVLTTQLNISNRIFEFAFSVQLEEVQTGLAAS